MGRRTRNEGEPKSYHSGKGKEADHMSIHAQKLTPAKAPMREPTNAARSKGIRQSPIVYLVLYTISE